MYLKSATIHNVRSIATLRWDVGRPTPGWNVIIGDNGAGKSSLLRAIALALVGPTEAAALRLSWDEWLRSGSTIGTIDLDLDNDPASDKFTKGGRTVKKYYLQAYLKFARTEEGLVELKAGRMEIDPTRHVWGNGAGWFSASYGPFRRFTGGDKDQEKLYYAKPKLARHLSVFGESVALTECIDWLKTLQFKKLEGDREGDLLDPIIQFINQPSFLPHSTRLQSISSKGVVFVDGNGVPVAIEDLSDGYRSILSMTIELIRQLTTTFGSHRLFSTDRTTIVVPGIVLIDEIDAHLHPIWQRRVGTWFREHFPNLQFIVTTHSPFICQAANLGSVFQLPRPGGSDAPRMVSGLDLERLLYGSILDAYGTGMFGDGVTRSIESLNMMARLAELNQRELASPLSPAEQEERDRLRTILPTASTQENAP